MGGTRAASHKGTTTTTAPPATAPGRRSKARPAARRKGRKRSAEPTPKELLEPVIVDRPRRVHLIAHANPAQRDVERFGFAGTDAYLAFVRAHLPRSLTLTCSKKLLEVVETPERGGRRDDDARVRDLQNALDDPNTAAIVALSGGAWFSRILPRVDFAALRSRRDPLYAFGFSEMTGLVNLVASTRSGRGVYWLCPNYLAWKIKPAERARAAFGAFWAGLPEWMGGRDSKHASPRDAGAPHARAAGALEFPPHVEARLVQGRVAAQRVRVVGGCISVLSALLTGPPGRGLRPHNRWLVIEDVNEQFYRIDRHLAALQFAGWLSRVSGVLVADFHISGPDGSDQTEGVVELVRRHLPDDRRRTLPILVAPTIGHVWPMAPLPLNRPLRVEVRGRRVRLIPPAR